MIHLLPLMLERVGILIILAFVLSQFPIFRHIIYNRRGRFGSLLLIAVFGLFGVISNYTGIEIHLSEVVSQSWLNQVDADNAIANTRIMGVSIGGLLGGPLVGLGVGLVAGLHRYPLGGFTALECAISSVLAGVVAGLLGNWYRRRGVIPPWFAALVGMAMQVVEMLLILLFSKPYEDAVMLVQTIGLPMIVLNGFGTLLFMLIIRSILKEQERQSATQTHLAFHIADRTLPFFRQGLNPDSCREAAHILLRLTEADAISITNRTHILAHVGAAADHHVAGQEVSTGLTRTVLEQGKLMLARLPKDIRCSHRNCPLEAAVVLPLLVHGEAVGTLKLYFCQANHLSKVEEELAEGLGKLFSAQLELAEAEQQSALLKTARIKALQAQVHPHFLFNAINTISVLCRTDSERARRLLLELGTFFRSNLQGAQQLLIPLYKELEYVEAYLQLEQARFPDKYTVELDIEPGLEQVQVPPFIIQPLVENAIRHGFRRLQTRGTIRVSISSHTGELEVIVADNGAGIPADRLALLGHEANLASEGSGTALCNIRERLEGIYRHSASFMIQSAEGEGTAIHIRLPLQYQEGSKVHADSVYRG
ncbi:sensor histidine kinase [Paenibacillus hunanensis]|uniref:sensor histidine kinase n=1 Tax=Paenibacillus hunanensis TaxID=539262 RepID=UPI002A6B7F78|nr:sensor histidine kinase [Paenibacillus hunanensis]WPP41253.1 sensor histidine kinase [Paenibacillus hunanensis]